MKGCIVVLKGGKEFDFPNCRYEVFGSAETIVLYKEDVAVATWLYDAVAGVYDYEI